MKILYFVLAGVLGGILAGMGMGGGTLTMPLLVLALGVPQILAQYANLLAFLPSGAAALCIHLKNGLVSKSNILYLLFPALLTCAITSKFATEIDATLLKQLFGGFLVAISIFSFSAKVAKKC